MFPRRICRQCQVLWTDLGDDPECWVCGKPGARTGDNVLAPGVHRYEPARTVVCDRALVWRIDQEDPSLW